MKRTLELARDEHIARLAADLRARSKRGSFDGRDTPAWRRYLAHCRVADTVTGALLIFTRDVGMHSCGWFKNPDSMSVATFERSISRRGARVARPDRRGPRRS